MSLGLSAFSTSAFGLTQKAELEPLETWIKVALDDTHRLHLQALQGTNIRMPFRFEFSRGSSIPLALPPCLPSVAFFEAERWLAKPEGQGGMEFKRWFTKHPGYQIWNGKNCVDYLALYRQTQTQLRDALYALLQHPDDAIRQRVGGYLKAWLS